MDSKSDEKSLALVVRHNPYKNEQLDDSMDPDSDVIQMTYINYSWSRRIVDLVKAKARLVDSFASSPVSGFQNPPTAFGCASYSKDFGNLPIGKQLKLAKFLGDERLVVLCHLFNALSTLRTDNRQICLNYIKNVVLPLLNSLPYRDPIVTNMLRLICFRLSLSGRLYDMDAIEQRNEE